MTKETKLSLAKAFLLIGTMAITIWLWFSACFVWFGLAVFHEWASKPNWKVRCLSCHGTGLCRNDDGSINQTPRKPPHSCCGGCSRVAVPLDWVPSNFDGNRVAIGGHLNGKGTWRLAPSAMLPMDVSLCDQRTGFKTMVPLAIIGDGLVDGSLYQRIWRGGPRKRLGLLDSER